MPFVETPTKEDRDFWTLKIDGRQGADTVLARFQPRTAEPVIKMTLEGVLVVEVPTINVPKVEFTARFPLTDQIRQTYLSMDEHYPVDPTRLKQQVLDLGLASSAGTSTFREFLERSTSLAKTWTYAEGPKLYKDYNEFYAKSATNVGACQQLNSPPVLAGRVLGIPSRKISGRYAGGNDGHATCQFYDEALQRFVPFNASGIAVNKKLDLTGIAMIARSACRGLIVFEDDSCGSLSGRAYPGDPLCPGGDGDYSVNLSSSCGEWCFLDGKEFAGGVWPTSSASGRVYRAIPSSDPQFIFLKN